MILCMTKSYVLSFGVVDVVVEVLCLIVRLSASVCVCICPRVFFVVFPSLTGFSFVVSMRRRQISYIHLHMYRLGHLEQSWGTY